MTTDPTATAAGITGAMCGLCGRQIVLDYPARPDTYIHRDTGDEDCQPDTAATAGLRCVRCWQGLGPDHSVDEAEAAIIVAQGQSLCEAHARSTWDAVWG